MKMFCSPNNWTMVTSIPPVVNDFRRYTIDETCGILGIHRSTLRRYTDSGLIKCGYRREAENSIWEAKFRASGRLNYEGMDISS